MRLLLDEMISATVAAVLRDRGFDVVALQDPEWYHLRGTADAEVLAHAHAERRAVVTDNVADYLAAHHARIATGETHHGLVFFTNDTFPRHRHDQFVTHVLAALEATLRAGPDDDDGAWVHWLAP